MIHNLIVHTYTRVHTISAMNIIPSNIMGVRKAMNSHCEHGVKPSCDNNDCPISPQRDIARQEQTRKKGSITKELAIRNIQCTHSMAHKDSTLHKRGWCWLYVRAQVGSRVMHKIGAKV